MNGWHTTTGCRNKNVPHLVVMCFCFYGSYPTACDTHDIRLFSTTRAFGADAGHNIAERDANDHRQKDPKGKVAVEEI
jgi:hypothetical protein